MPTSTWAIVVAAGSGERFGARKQFLRLGYGRVVDWALRSAREHCAGVVLVVPADSLGEPESLHPAAVVVAGGSTRSAPVRQGLDRQSVVLGRGVSVRVDLGGRGIIKTKKKK